MPQGKGTYGSQVGRPSEKKKQNKAETFAAKFKSSNKQAKYNEMVASAGAERKKKFKANEGRTQK